MSVWRSSLDSCRQQCYEHALYIIICMMKVFCWKHYIAEQRKWNDRGTVKFPYNLLGLFPTRVPFLQYSVPPPSHPTFPAFALRYVCVCNSTRRCQLSKNSTMSTCLLMLKIRSHFLPSFWFLYIERTNVPTSTFAYYAALYRGFC